MATQTAIFNINPLSQFESKATTIRRPRHLLQFSFDDEHKLHVGSDASLRYYYPPYIEAPGTSAGSVDLSQGFDGWVKADETVDNHLDGLVETIQTHEESLLNDGTTDVEDVRAHVDVVTWRGMMTKIMTAPFDMFSDFEMNATCFQDTIYVEENYAYGLAEKQQQNKKPSRPGEASQEMMQYWGYNFETLSTLPKPWAECTREEIESRQDEAVNNNAQYCSIVRTGMGNTSLIIGGEVDCLIGERPENPDDPIPWVELKTTAEPPSTHHREIQKYERKQLRFWAQSFLLGVPKIIVGFRDQAGLLTRIQELETQKIPGQVARGQGSWSGNVCINFASAFLEFLKQTVIGTEGVWRIKRAKNSREIEVFRVEAVGTGRVLRDSFKAHREKLRAAEIAAKLGGGTTAPSIDT